MTPHGRDSAHKGGHIELLHLWESAEFLTLCHLLSNRYDNYPS